jgi:hypothetical protein
VVIFVFMTIPPDATGEQRRYPESHQEMCHGQLVRDRAVSLGKARKSEQSLEWPVVAELDRAGSYPAAVS